MKSNAYKNRFDHVCSSLMFCSHALHEYMTLTTHYDLKEVNEMISRAPFNFYRATLPFLIILEYCKLFHHNKRDKSLSNVEKLCALAAQKISFEHDDIYRGIIGKLENIPESDLYKTLRKLRNKRFAHSDRYKYNIPFKIQGFTSDQIGTLSEHLNIGGSILNHLRKIDGDDTLLFPHNKEMHNSTESMIYETSIARAFFVKNQGLAYRQGFQLWQRKNMSA